MAESRNPSPSPRPAPDGDEHFRELFWSTLGRLVLLYFVPLFVLAVFFHIQYRQLLSNSRRAHLEVVAEHQARLFDLFLRERMVDLENVADDPLFPPGKVEESVLEAYLAKLIQTSDAFVDLGVVDGEGNLTAYRGPVQYPAPVNYRDEDWFQELLSHGDDSIITEIYLGFRDLPHFTMALVRRRPQGVQILRSALSPERLSAYLTTLEGANEVHAAIVNARGILQVTTPRLGPPLVASPFTPPPEKERGFVPRDRETGRPDYAYAWLSETPWALVVTEAAGLDQATGVMLPGRLLPVTVALFLLVGVVILIRTRQVVGAQLAAEQDKAELSGQLVHAAKLASVGELAAGIAHEINNPLAIIAEEVGVLRDSFDPSLEGGEDDPLDLEERLDAIHEAVFRCRDITRKLLTFVRQTPVKVGVHDLHEILADVLEVMLGNELSISDIEVVRRYDDRIPPITTDRNQLVQVFVNLVKNAMDAMPGGGMLTVTTLLGELTASVSIGDTGVGMTRDQMERVFLPFFTTKDPGKGTGLGLSVSYSIIQNFGGAFYVDSSPGKGSVFTVELPLQME